MIGYIVYVEAVGGQTPWVSTVERIAFRPRIGLAELRGGESSEPSEEQLRAHSARNEDDDEARGIFRDVTHAVGVVPIVGLHRVSRICHDHTCFLELESCNPGGAIKEKNAVYLVDRAEEEGKLRPGGVIVESSSGNFGIGLAMVGRFGATRSSSWSTPRPSR